MKKLLRKIDLTNSRQLQTLVENRRIYNLQNCELNIFESYTETYRVPLTFHDFVITSMVRGKKVMHLFDKPSFNYLPGETVIVPANETMVIDFPEAEKNNPTQCIALAVDAHYVNNTLDFLNNYYNHKEDGHHWKLEFSQYHFENDTEITDTINKLIKVCSSDDVAKSIYADLSMKELLIRLLQSQHLMQVHTDAGSMNNHSRLHFVLHYIQQNLTEKLSIDTICRKAFMSRNEFYKWFKDQFGVTPLEYINRERIKLAKQLLADKKNNISDIGLQCGFTDVNYFVRRFRKSEGITPGGYRGCAMN